MKHTECKDCKLREGDCGHHFKMDRKTDYDIASLTCCDRYGNCEFFQQKEVPKGDLISREALKNALHNFFDGKVIDEPTYILRDVFCHIDGAPTVELTEADIQEVLNKCCMTAVANEYLIALHNKNCKPKGKWIPRLHASENDIYVCSCCAKELGYDPNFCPNCGADMRN